MVPAPQLKGLLLIPHPSKEKWMRDIFIRPKSGKHCQHLLFMCFLLTAHFLLTGGCWLYLGFYNGFAQNSMAIFLNTLPTQRCPVILGRLSCNSMLSCCRCESVFTEDRKMSFSNCQNNDNTPACKRNTFLFQACILLPQNVSICIRCSPFVVSILKWTQSQMASQAFGMSDGLMGALNCESY